MKTLLFIGHPGHELLAYKFLNEHKPHVIFLTTGSGNNDQPRINGSVDLVSSLGLQVFTPFEPFTDREIYTLIMTGEFERFTKVKDALKTFIELHNIDRIVGDALEGFNPSHDLCRYIINGCVQDLNGSHNLENYDFLQDEVFRNSQAEIHTSDIVLKLNNDEMEAKLAACKKYSELKFEVDRFFEAYGADFFKLEYFRHITDTLTFSNWQGEQPFYEIHGRKRVKEGIYKKALLYNDHMLPIAKHLLGK